MDLGAEKQQLERLRQMYVRWSADAVQLRFLVILVLLLVGIFAVERPLAGALVAARARNADAETTARLAEELCQLTDQVTTYSSRAGIDADLVAWQNYVLEKLGGINATLTSLEPHKTVPKGPFLFIEMELVAKGTDFSQFVDFIDRIEHGDRLIRLDKLRFERTQTAVNMTAVIRGLVKVGPATKSSPAAVPATGAGKPSPTDSSKPGEAPSTAADLIVPVGPMLPTDPTPPADATAPDAAASDPAATDSAPPDTAPPQAADASADASADTNADTNADPDAGAATDGSAEPDAKPAQGGPDV